MHFHNIAMAFIGMWQSTRYFTLPSGEIVCDKSQKNALFNINVTKLFYGSEKCISSYLPALRLQKYTKLVKKRTFLQQHAQMVKMFHANASS